VKPAEKITVPKHEYEALVAKNMQLSHRLAQLERMIFGRKSERFAADNQASQPTLFSGLEAPSPVAEEPSREQITYERKKGKGVEKLHPGRNELPASLPRQEVVVHFP
jgi:hypothetical protein